MSTLFMVSMIVRIVFSFLLSIYGKLVQTPFKRFLESVQLLNENCKLYLKYSRVARVEIEGTLPADYGTGRENFV